MPLLLTRQSDETVLELKQFIAKSPDISEWGKKAVLYLINHTDNLSKLVFMMIPRDKKELKKLAEQAAYGVHNMNSSVCKTHLGSFLEEKGIRGHFIGSDYGRAFMAIWFTDKSLGFDDGRLELIEFDEETINKIKLPQ